ncbi:MAG: threonine/serine dehydratase [Gemmatimonadota bacterium]
MTADRLVELSDVLAARNVVAGRIHRTPVFESATLSAMTGTRLAIKLESFQKTGSFKVRGVLNKLHHLSAEERRRGVVTLSAGNHAQALAWAARDLGIHAVVVMPAGAVRSKVEATRGYGGEVVLTEGDLLATCLEIQRTRDLVLVHPFDDPLVIAGQGTVGIEIVEEVPDLEVILVGVGGGGLISGIATATAALRPGARVIGVEPEGAAVISRSLEAGEPLRLERLDTVADGLAAPFAGRHTLAHVRARVAQVVTVPDAAIVDAMRILLERCKLLAEPAASAPLAALIARRFVPPPGARVVCVVSGGNIDAERLKALL